MGDLSVDCWTHSCKWSYVSHYSWWPTGGFNHEVEVLSIRWCLWWVRALLRRFMLLWWANWILHHHDLIHCYSHWQLEPHTHRFTLISHNLEWIDTHALLACIVTMLCTSHLHVMQEAGWWGLPGLKPLVFWAVFLCSMTWLLVSSEALHSSRVVMLVVHFLAKWIRWLFIASYSYLNLLLIMSPTKILLIVVVLIFLGLAALAFQLTKGINDSEPSIELQEAMPALQ